MLDWLWANRRMAPDPRITELERAIEEQAATLRKQGWCLVDLERKLDRAKLTVRFHKQVSAVYRRRWELAANPAPPAQTADAKRSRDGEARIAAAINARVVPGDAEGARHLRSYADRRVAEMLADGKGEVDYDAVATEILDGEDDDE